MSKTILANVGGFIPVIESLVAELGHMPALVFGVVWNFCQMEDGVCTASQDRIGERCGISGRRARDHLETLAEAGYLAKTVKPGVGVIYYDTGKAGLVVNIQAKPAASEKPIHQVPDNPGRNVLPTPDETSGHPGRNVLPTPDETSYKENLLIDSLKDTRARGETPPAEIDEFSRMQALVETLTGYPSTPKDAPAINEMISLGITEDDLRGALAWFKKTGNVARGAAGILPSTKRARAERIQAQSAGPSPGNGNSKASRQAKNMAVLDEMERKLHGK